MTVNKGEENGRSKLTDAKVLEARKMHKVESKSVSFLARQFGVSKPTMLFALRSDTWKHLPKIDYQKKNHTPKWPKATKSIEQLVARGYNSSNIVRILQANGSKMPKSTIEYQVRKFKDKL